MLRKRPLLLGLTLATLGAGLPAGAATASPDATLPRSNGAAVAEARNVTLRAATTDAAAALPASRPDQRRWIAGATADLVSVDAEADARSAAAFAAAMPALAEQLTVEVPVPPAPAAAPAPAPGSGGGFRCPVVGGSTFTNDFGAPRPGRRHEGVDLMGQRGQDLVAVESGVVKHTRSASGGNQVWLHGDSGTRYFYAHLDGYVGGPRRVAAGEVVGTMGKTGRTGAVHLHFEIRPGGGRAVNPFDALRAAC